VLAKWKTLLCSTTPGAGSSAEQDHLGHLILLLEIHERGYSL
jgi:hypothetical protein